MSFYTTSELEAKLAELLQSMKGRPAGEADDIFKRACNYYRRHIGVELTRAQEGITWTKI